MSTLQEIEKAIKHLSTPDLARLRNWFAEFDAEAWDRQIESDIKAGRLDQLAEEALRENREGRTTDL